MLCVVTNNHSWKFPNLALAPATLAALLVHLRLSAVYKGSLGREYSGATLICNLQCGFLNKWSSSHKVLFSKEAHHSSCSECESDLTKQITIL